MDEVCVPSKKMTAISWSEACRRGAASARGPEADSGTEMDAYHKANTAGQGKK